MTTTAPVRIAVIGAGGWGKNHVRNYAAMPEAELLYVCDTDEEVRDAVNAMYPSVLFPSIYHPHFLSFLFT